MALTMEEKILGVEPVEEKKDVKKTADVFTANNVWLVSKKGCGTTLMNGRMVATMLDYDVRKQFLSGKRELKLGDTTYKLKK